MGSDRGRGPTGVRPSIVVFASLGPAVAREEVAREAARALPDQPNVTLCPGRWVTNAATAQPIPDMLGPCGSLRTTSRNAGKGDQPQGVRPPQIRGLASHRSATLTAYPHVRRGSGRHSRRWSRGPGIGIDRVRPKGASRRVRFPPSAGPGHPRRGAGSASLRGFEGTRGRSRACSGR